MKQSILVALLGAIVIVAAGRTAGDERDDLQKTLVEIRERETRLAMITRTVLPVFDPAVEQRFLKSIAEQAKVSLAVKVLAGAEAVPLDDGTPSPVQLYTLEITGRDQLYKVASLLRFVAIRESRLQDLETLRIVFDAAGQASFVARLVVPVYKEPEQTPPPTRGGILAAAHARLERTKALETFMKRLVERYARHRLGAASVLLDSLDGVDAVRLTEVDLGPEVVIKGAALGAPARAAIRAGLEKAGWAVAKIQMPPSGACRPFAVTARPGKSEQPMEVVGERVVDDRTVSLCQLDTVPALGAVVARGETSESGDALTFRLRNTDLAAVFVVLNDLTKESFVVDHDVRGRLNVDVERATLQEVLTAMRSAGVVVSEGPLRRVSRAGTLQTPLTQTYTGEPVSLNFQGADLRSILCVLKEITALDFEVPPDLHVRVHAFITEQPWDRALEGLITSAGLRYAIDDGPRVFVGPPSAVEARAKRSWESSCTRSSPAPSRFADEYLRLEQLGITDLTLAGVADTKDGWKGYVYGAGRALMQVGPDQELYDGRVTKVSRDGISLLDRASRSVEMRLETK